MKWASFIALILGCLHGETAGVTHQHIQDAITRMQTHLLGQQDPLTGGWEGRYADSEYHHGGESALVMLALLQSGVSIQHPQMMAGAEFLEKANMQGTYAVSLRAHCWAALPDNYRPQLSRDARWLLRAQSQGLFDYGRRTGPRYDHSVTQYGLLGLWESSKRKGPSSGRIWSKVASHFVRAQNQDGGWGYQGDMRSTRTMTAAGLTAMLIAQERLYLNNHKPPEHVSEAIERGLSWLDQEHRDSKASIGSRWGMYYLVSLERVALASGIKTFGGNDWFETGAREILDAERGRGSLGSDNVQTAFALFFLSRGRVPVWINKLQLHAVDWNNRPNDLNLLTRRLSEEFEQELNWQAVDIHADPLSWVNAPVAYLASDSPPKLSSTALANLKRYLDLGGMLIATPDADSKAFAEAIHIVGKRLYPAYQFERVRDNHPLLGLVHPVDIRQEDRPTTLSNGVRDLIILAEKDWGMTLQSGQMEQQTGANKIMTNLYAMVSDRGRGGHRIASPITNRSNDEADRVITVSQIQQPGRPLIEPSSWEPLRNHFENHTGIQLSVLNQSIEQATGHGVELLHLKGVKSVAITPREVRALVRYINNGGTVLIEAVGGRGDYAASLGRQLSAVYATPPVMIDSHHPMLTGQNHQNGYDCRKTSYRRFSVLQLGLSDVPRLEMIQVNGRAAVIISHEDLSLGVLGVRHWGVNGYEPTAARELLSNILLYTISRDKKAEVIPTDNK